MYPPIHPLPHPKLSSLLLPSFWSLFALGKLGRREVVGGGGEQEWARSPRPASTRFLISENHVPLILWSVLAALELFSLHCLKDLACFCFVQKPLKSVWFLTVHFMIWYLSFQLYVLGPIKFTRMITQVSNLPRAFAVLEYSVSVS